LLLSSDGEQLPFFLDVIFMLFRPPFEHLPPHSPSPKPHLPSPAS